MFFIHESKLSAVKKAKFVRTPSGITDQWCCIIILYCNVLKHKMRYLVAHYQLVFAL